MHTLGEVVLGRVEQAAFVIVTQVAAGEAAQQARVARSDAERMTQRRGNQRAKAAAEREKAMAKHIAMVTKANAAAAKAAKRAEKTAARKSKSAPKKKAKKR